MGNGGLGHAQQRRDVAHAHLRLKKHVQNADAGGIAENAEQFRQVVQGVLAGHFLLDLFHDLVMGVHEFAALYIVSVLHVALLSFEYLFICS